uniref:Glycosyltransferase subfamily 4-like N-terminal domain-containing protein n=1 Tax=Fervidobacterium pennivorans TaxID=93466 RepID=A0A7V4NFP4_FERPE
MKTIWIVDKDFVPDPLPAKNRYKIFLDIPDLKVKFFCAVERSALDMCALSTFVWNKDINNYAEWSLIRKVKGNKFIYYISFALAFFMKTLFVKEKPDIIVASCPDPFQALAGLIIAKLRKAHLVVDFRDYWPELLWQLGLLKEKSLIGRLIFWLTGLIARNAEGIMSAEESFIKEYLKSRKADKKMVFVRENVHVKLNEHYDSTTSLSSCFVEKVKNIIRAQKRQGRKIVVMAGTLNIGPKSYEMVENFLKKMSDNICILVFSSDQKFQAIFHKVYKDNFYMFQPVAKNEFLAILKSVDALLMFVENLIGSAFSSNKLFDAISIGIPVLCGVIDHSQVNKQVSQNIPGVYTFNINDISRFKDILRAFPLQSEEVSKILMFVRQKYLDQVRGLSKFLELVAERKVPE